MNDKDTWLANIQINTGLTYTNNYYDDLLSDPYASGNINLGSILSNSISPLPPLNLNNLALNSNQTYYNSSAIYGESSVRLGKSGIELNEECDLTIGDRSLKGFMNDIEKRLALLQVNTKLEKEWDELKELGDRYRQLEKEIQEKLKTWDILSKDDEVKLQK